MNRNVSYLDGNGFFNLGRGFDRIYVHDAQGGEDRILLLNVYDSHYLYGRDNFAYLETDHVLVWLYGAERVAAHAAAGHNPSSDVTAVDFIFEQVGQWSS